MFLRIPNVLTPVELEKINTFLAQSEFIDGKQSAGSAASQVKQNLQLDQQATNRSEYDKLVIEAINKHPLIQNFAFPRYIFASIFSKYECGMQYGNHVDNPVMNIGQPRRTDLSITVFLNEPSEYDGGELAIETMAGTVRIKLPPGDAILYPSFSVHRVEPITRGVRMAAIAWIQSYIRDNSKREILHELGLVRNSLEQSIPSSNEVTCLTKNYYNLIRMWTEI